MIRMTTMVGCVLGLAAFTLQAADPPGSAGARDASDRAGAYAHGDKGDKAVCLASKHIGKTVQTEGQEKIGTLKDLVIDSSGQVKYLAVSSQDDVASTLPGRAAADQPADRTPTQPGQRPPAQANQQDRAAAGGDMLLIPFSLVKAEKSSADDRQAASARDDQTITVQIKKEDLAQAPRFSKQQLTQGNANQQWMAQVDQFFQDHTQRSARPDLGDSPARDRNTPVTPPTTPRQ